MSLPAPYLDDGDVRALARGSWRDALRFLSKVVRDGDCWRWTGAVDAGGYGEFRMDGATRRAHRVAYEQFVGPIPDGLEPDHLCRNRWCVNPLHLEAVPRSVNTERGWRHANRYRRPPHCPQGHEFTPENTYHDPKTGWRSCRSCRATQARKRRRRAHVA